jgi:hypothetical protein
MSICTNKAELIHKILECPIIRTMMSIMSTGMVEVAAYQDEDVVVGVEVIIGIVSQNLNENKMGSRMRTIISWSTRRNSNT